MGLKGEKYDCTTLLKILTAKQHEILDGLQLTTPSEAIVPVLGQSLPVAHEQSL